MVAPERAAVGSGNVSASSKTAIGRIRYWWQARPMVGLLAGWIVIALIGWRVWSALNGRHA